MNTAKQLPVIVDTTLRDGIQMPGAVLDFNRKAAIFDRLARLGIREAEIGCPAQGAAAVHEMRTLGSRHPEIISSAWCRARKEDIDAAIESGVGTVHISFPVSDRHIRITGLSRLAVLERCTALIRYTLSAAGRVTIGAQDATRADSAFLLEFVSAAHAAGAERIRIADTVGIATPQSITGLIARIKTACPEAALEYHGHNDFGLATATTLAAMEQGIQAVSVTVQGVGERAGNAALEEVITAAVILYGYTAGLHLESLADLCSCTAESFAIPLRPHKAMCGENAFNHESGIHCHGTLRDPLAYQPIPAAAVGRSAGFSIGPQSGSSTLQAVLRAHGIPIDRNDVRTIWRHYHDAH
jgi:homocitrate synthase NifV